MPAHSLWMKTPMHLAAPLGCLLLLLHSGCASILNAGNQSVEVNSSPAGATVYANGNQVGTTPFTYTYEGSDGRDVQLELRKEGHEPANLMLKLDRSNAVLFADAMLLGLPYIVDSQSRSLYSFRSSGVTANLYRSVPTGRQRLDLPVADLQHGMATKQSLGKVGGRSINLESREMNSIRYPQSGTMALVKGMNGTWADAGYVRPGTPKGDEEARRAKVLLRPFVQSLEIDAKEKKGTLDGRASTVVDWRFYNGLAPDDLLFTISKATSLNLNNVHARDAMDVILQDAGRQLMDEPGLYERLASARAEGLILSKGDQMLLTAPPPVTYTDRRTMFPALVKSVVTVEMKNGHGSGFLITTDGYLLTNAHVVQDEATAKVKFEQGFSLEGRVVKVNRDFDLALLKVQGSDLPALGLGDDAALVVGEELFAIGTPLDEKLGQTVSRGIVSGRREIDGRKYLQTDVGINPGNSGGPLIDERGKVVGIATMKAKAVGVEGIGFGVPISTALEMLNIEFKQP